MQSYPQENALVADGAANFYSSSNNPNHAALSNPDELQLTAQLSRGLAPTMNACQGGNMAEGQEGRSHDGLQPFGQEQEAHHHPIQPSQVPMDQMGGQFMGADTQTAPRKRSKVSRACDECRRKKIRCDATGEPGDDQCSSCKRVGARCQFSRVPMKRGPSKGYIKELADRLHGLESAYMGGGHLDNAILPHRPSEEFSPPPHGDMANRKRTFSNVSADFNTSYQVRPSTGYSAQDQSRHQDGNNAFNTPQSAPVPQMFKDPNYSPNGLPPSPHWKKPPEPFARQSSSFEGLQSAELGHVEQVADWDDNIVTGYYNNIHSTYPVLPQSRNVLNARVGACPTALKDAFHESLGAAVRSFSLPASQPLCRQSIKKAAQLVLSLQFESPSARPFSVNLVYLQTMLLMAIASSNHAWGGQTGLSRSIWLSTGVSLAYELHLHQSIPREANDSDAEENISRKVWWSLVIMDRWHASSISAPLLIPDESVVVHPNDQLILGDSMYHLARLSVILGHFSMASLTAEESATLGVRPLQVLNTVLRGELERWRETLPASIFPPQSSPIVLVCYWHLRILMELRLPESDSSQILAAATNISNLATQNSNIITPLTYNAIGLTSLALVDLLGDESMREGANPILKSLLDTGLVPCEATIREMMNKKQSSGLGETTASETANLGLQRLADLATATEGRNDNMVDTRNEGEKINTLSGYSNLAHAIKDGYLSILTGGATR